MNLSETRVVKDILACRPDLAIDSVSYLGEGDFCTAFLVNREWIFRFAKHEAARESLKREFCLLPKLSAMITLSIPLPEISCFELQRENCFSAYRLLSGDVLTKSAYIRLSGEDRTACAAQAALFLNQMHSAGLRAAESCAVPVNDYRSQYSELLSQLREDPLAGLDKSELVFVERAIENYLQSPDAANFRPSLLHGDLSPGHFLFDRKTHRISGVIDFGDMMIGDPAWDLLWIYEDYGLDFLSRLMPMYLGPDKPAMLRRVYQFSHLQAIETAANCRENTEDDLAGTVENLRAAIIKGEDGLERLLAIL